MAQVRRARDNSAAFRVRRQRQTGPIQIQFGGKAFYGRGDGAVGRRWLEEKRAERRENLRLGKKRRFCCRGSAKVDIYRSADTGFGARKVAGIVLSNTC